MAWMKCDSCGLENYTDENPFVEMRIPRPSDRSCMTCVMAGHWKCFHQGQPVPTTIKNEDFTGGGSLPSVMWHEWIESTPARRAGFLFLD